MGIVGYTATRRIRCLIELAGGLTVIRDQVVEYAVEALTTAAADYKLVLLGLNTLVEQHDILKGVSWLQSTILSS